VAYARGAKILQVNYVPHLDYRAMRSLVLFVLLLASIPAALSSQAAGYRYGGTFIGAVIAEDGIVMASDSRTTFMDGSGRAFGYLDGMPKIYVDRGSAVAVSGLSSLKGELFSSFVRRNEYLLARPVNEILFGFLVWLPFQNSEAVGLISAGFIGGKPMICTKSPILDQACSNVGFINNKNSPMLRDRLTMLGRPLKSTDAAAALRAAIVHSASTDPTVGGPISIVKLNVDGPPQWFENQPDDRGLTQICDLVREHRSGHRRIIPARTRQELELHLDAACPR
jgi:hypothetical protein